MNEVLYEGKTKAIYPGPNEESLLLRFTDNATAFNGEKKAVLPGKGKLNAAISNLIYIYLMENGVETHLINAVDDVTVLVKKADIVMVEVIVRNLAAGSFTKKYGVPEGTPLQNTTVEFSLKNDSLGDPVINGNHITALGLATRPELEVMTSQAAKINKLLQTLFTQAGITLVDFKLEFGRCGGKLILCDEISPDSCRLWDMKTNQKLDKDRFRRDLGGVLDSYREILRRLQNVRQI